MPKNYSYSKIYLLDIYSYRNCLILYIYSYRNYLLVNKVFLRRFGSTPVEKSLLGNYVKTIWDTRNTSTDMVLVTRFGMNMCVT